MRCARSLSLSLLRSVRSARSVCCCIPVTAATERFQTLVWDSQKISELMCGVFRTGGGCLGGCSRCCLRCARSLLLPSLLRQEHQISPMLRPKSLQLQQRVSKHLLWTPNECLNSCTAPSRLVAGAGTALLLAPRLLPRSPDQQEEKSSGKISQKMRLKRQRMELASNTWWQASMSPQIWWQNQPCRARSGQKAQEQSRRLKKA